MKACYENHLSTHLQDADATADRITQIARIDPNYTGGASEKPQSYVAKIEGCERRLDVLEVVELCQVLGVSASEMIKIIE